MIMDQRLGFWVGLFSETKCLTIFSTIVVILQRCVPLGWPWVYPPGLISHQHGFIKSVSCLIAKYQPANSLHVFHTVLLTLSGRSQALSRRLVTFFFFMSFFSRSPDWCGGLWNNVRRDKTLDICRAHRPRMNVVSVWWWLTEWHKCKQFERHIPSETQVEANLNRNKTADRSYQ